MTERISKSETDLAKKLMIAACGLVTIDTLICDSLDAIHVRLVARNSRWTRRRVRALYDLEARKVRFSEITDLLALIREADEATFQSFYIAISAEFIGATPAGRSAA